MTNVILSLVVILMGCGDDEATVDDIEAATLAALGGVEPDEETAKKWKEISQSSEARFLGYATPVVEKNCFQKEQDFYTCQRNTNILKEKDWVSVKNEKGLFAKTFAEGVRLFLGDPKKPEPDYEQSLRERLRVSEERKTKAETELTSLRPEAQFWKDKTVEIAFKEPIDAKKTVLNAICGSDDGRLLIENNPDVTGIRTAIDALLKDETEGFNKIRLAKDFSSIFENVKFKDMNEPAKFQSVSDKVHSRLQACMIQFSEDMKKLMN